GTAPKITRPEEPFKPFRRLRWIVSNQLEAHEIGTQVQHHRRLDLARMTHGLARPLAKLCQLILSQLPIGGSRQNRIRMRDVKPPQRDVQGIDVATVSIEEKQTAKASANHRFTYLDQDSLIR